MYGFVEPWITEAFHIDHTTYGIGDGNTVAHIIEEHDFERIFILIRDYSSRATNQILERPQIINSNVVGLKIMLMRYWVNEDILFSLTDGPIKESHQFRFFMNMSNPRFDMARLIGALNEMVLYGHIRSREFDPSEINQTPSNVVSPPIPAREAQREAEVLSEDIQHTIRIINEAADRANTANIRDDNTIGTTEDPMHDNVVGTIENAMNDIYNGVTQQQQHVTLDNIEDLENRVALEAAVELAEAAEATEAVEEELVTLATATIEVPKKDSKEVKEDMGIKLEGEAFINHILAVCKTKSDITVFKTNNGYFVMHHSNTLLHTRNLLSTFAENIKKNVIFGSYNIYSAEIRKFDTKDIAKHTIIINVAPQACPDKQFVQQLSTSYVTCLGRMIKRPWLVYGSKVNSEIDDARINRSTNTVDRILSNNSNSPYYRYDMIFKDTYTGVVWAVKDRCVIHILVDFSERDIFQVCLNEISRRINGNIPYRELLKIDKDYFDDMNNSNMDEYVDFAVSNSKQIYNELVEKLNANRNNFNTYMAKAMECAKSVQRYEDQLAAFDMKTFENKEREKALKTYQDTMALNKVKCITINSGSVNVYTKNIYVKDPRTNKWHDIGTFHIILGMLGEMYDTNNTVRVFNTKFSGMGMNGDFQAPHIYNDGHICHGNMASGMVAAYKERNLFDLIYQIIIFLQSVNVSDAAGNYINTWPEVTEEFVQADEAEMEMDQGYEKVSEVEKKFDEALCDAIPIHIN